MAIDGNRTLAVQPDGTKVYTPFPEYEKTVPVTGSPTERNHYYVAGQYIATRVKVAGQAGAFYFVFTDRQGSVANMRKADGTWVNSSTARYDAFGGYRTKPATTVNPDISDRGYTGHRMNNTGNDLGLIYMNARYYLPEVGRFISADTIVPDPKDPQTYNRYSYALNSPTNHTDPTGHCTSNYEVGSLEMETCLSAWNSVSNYLFGAAFGPGGSGYFPNELVSDWLANADIGTLENLMHGFGIDYGYVYAPPQGYFATAPSGAVDLQRPMGRAEVCQYWQSCYDPISDYSAIGGNLPILIPFGLTIMWDDWGNVYASVTAAPSRGVGVYAGNVKVKEDGKLKDIEDLAVDRQEQTVEKFLTGWGDGGCAAMMLGGCLVGNPTGNFAFQMGFASPGMSPYLGYTWLIYDN